MIGNVFLAAAIGFSLMTAARGKACEKEGGTLPVISLDDPVRDMSIHDLASQMHVVQADDLHGGMPLTEADEESSAFLSAYPVGGILFTTDNMVSRDQVKAMLSGLSGQSEYPMILTCDEEGGMVSRLMHSIGTTEIGPMLSYEEEGTEKAYENAYTIASDMKSCGFNTDLAPVADVFSNSENTVIGSRAYSTDFDTASELIPAAVKGFHAGGVATALKHYPGHGDTVEDSHDRPAVVSRSSEELPEKELKPFKAGIRAGSDMVMTGHLLVENVDPDHIATFSPRLVDGMLRHELGFQGVVITDGMQMKAVTDYCSSGEAAVRAVEAGADLILQPMDAAESIRGLEDAVASGRLTRRRLEISVRRIFRMKAARGIMRLSDTVPEGSRMRQREGILWHDRMMK